MWISLPVHNTDSHIIFQANFNMQLHRIENIGVYIINSIYATLEGITKFKRKSIMHTSQVILSMT